MLSDQRLLVSRASLNTRTCAELGHDEQINKSSEQKRVETNQVISRAGGEQRG